MDDEKIIYNKSSGCYDSLHLAYYPGMVELKLADGWHNDEWSFNLSIADWRAMNDAVERTHGGIDG